MYSIDFWKSKRKNSNLVVGEPKNVLHQLLKISHKNSIFDQTINWYWQYIYPLGKASVQGLQSRAPVVWGISFRYGTVFLQNPGILVFFGTVLALYFHPRIFWKLFAICRFFFFGAISDQFREFPQLIGLLHICIYTQAAQEKKNRHRNKHYHQWGKVKQMQPMWLCILKGMPFEDTHENAQWRKVKQTQPMWLCILSGRQFEETHENAQWGKVKQM